MFKHLSDLEIQQMTFDWRYRGFTVLELLTEDECDAINDELDRLRMEYSKELLRRPWERTLRKFFHLAR